MLNSNSENNTKLVALKKRDSCLNISLQFFGEYLMEALSIAHN